MHAYDLNMQVPDTPNPPNDDESADGQSNASSNGRRPSIMVEGKSIFFQRGKRQRTSESASSAPAAKHRHLDSKESTHARDVSPHMESLRTAVEESDDVTSTMEGITENTTAFVEPEIALEMSEPESTVTPGLRHTQVRELLHLVINESLRVGGRPESAIAEDVDGGEIIEVRTRGSNGDPCTKMIEWSVDPQVPETIFGMNPLCLPENPNNELTVVSVDERDLAKLVSCVFLNAIKFTEEGKISLKATLTSKGKAILISIVDTGPGIPEAFLPYLFKPFSREDDSLTRQTEGLGLGLLVAKGLARKIGGDLLCVRSDTKGPRRGSEFELRVPISHTELNSRGSTPNRTPTSARFSEPTLKFRTRQTSSVGHQHPPRSHHSYPTTKTPESTPFAKATSPLGPSSESRGNSLPQQIISSPSRRPSTKKAPTFDRHLAKKYPITFLVAEDNKLNRKLLINMLGKLGYTNVYEAYDGVEAVKQMSLDRPSRGEKPVDVILMDLWMPNMDGYEATERIIEMERAKRDRSMKQKKKGAGAATEDSDDRTRRKPEGVTILAVSADVTESALERVREVGMEGFLEKPYKLLDLERLILEYCSGFCKEAS